MNMRSVWILAKNEIRSCSRLVRTWVFILIALFVNTSIYILDIRTVARTSWPDPPQGWTHFAIASQYTVNDIIFILSVLFMFGIVFLCNDVRARDIRSKISDVIDSRPMSNLEITVGRTSGILLLLLAPVLLFLVAITCYEVIAHFAGLLSRYGFPTIATMWLKSYDIVLLFLAFGAFVVFLASCIRNRFIVGLIGLVLLLGLIFFESESSIRFREAHLHSELAPVVLTASRVVSQFALVLLSCSFLIFAAAVLPRSQPRRNLFHVGGLAFLSVGVVCSVGLILSLLNVETRKQEWIEHHSAQAVEAFPDVQRIQGNIEISPGRLITADLTLTVHPSAINSTDSVVFSLNPGLTVQHVYVDEKEISNYDFEHGLLKISVSEMTGTEHELRVVVQGIPDKHFAYLDQARNLPATGTLWVRRLGTENYIFHPDFVALMPSIKWYPTSGSALYEDLLELRPRDTFTIDLNVSVPKTWIVAMVGHRETIESGDRISYNFKTHTPVPEIALVASNFDQRGKTIEGIDIELLFSKKHTKNLDLLAPYASEFENWVVERISRARELSLEYPYEEFYVIEVPSTLRIYGGGWRMDSVLQPPGMMLLRETTFPTARFETLVNDRDDSFPVSDTMVRNVVLGYFRDDLQGGSPHAAIARNFVNNQSSPFGHGGVAINYLVEQLATQLIMEQESLSVISLWDFGTVSIPASRFDTDYYYNREPTKKRLDLLRTPSTWDEIEQTPLFDLDFQSKPIPSFRALVTKCYAVAESMIAYYGTERVGAFLQRLTHTYKGQNYTFEDFVEIAFASEIDLTDWVLDYLEGTMLPGFSVSAPKVTKLKADETKPYQTTLLVHNFEPVSGFLDITGDDRPEPIFLKGHQTVEIAIQSTDPMYEIWIEPFLAYNREKFSVKLPEYDGESISENPAQQYLTEVDWTPPDSSAIIVDDLDPGFSIVGETLRKEEGFSFSLVNSFPNVEEHIDKGLPVRFTSIVGEWERKNDPYTFSFGRYRSTLALIARGTQNTHAKFSSELPHAGRWKLDYYVPGRVTRVQAYDFTDEPGAMYQRSVLRSPMAIPENLDEHYRLQIKDGHSHWNEQFDIAGAVEGWNTVETFQLTTDKVDVLVSDFAGRPDIIVYVDAIRWTPVDPK